MEKIILTLITVVCAAAFTLWGLAILAGVFQLSPLLGLVVLVLALPCLIFFGVLAWRQMRHTRDNPYQNIRY